MSPVDVFTNGVTVDRAVNFFSRLVPGVKTRQGEFSDVRPRSIIAFRKGSNPTFSYYLDARLQFYGQNMPVTIRCIDRDDLTNLDPAGAFVVVCRYLRTAHVNWILRNAHQLAGVGLFMDDDVSGILLSTQAPFSYRAKLVQLHLRPLLRLGNCLDVLWASTPPLASLLASNGSAVRLLPPLPSKAVVAPDDAARSSAELSIGFYATGIHAAEHTFLKPIVAEILTRYANVTFEVSASGRHARDWQNDLPKGCTVRIRPMLPWEEFVTYSREHPTDIVLVPLLNGRVNISRADTKRIDVCRMRAAAVFSDSEPYRRNRQPAEILVKNEHGSWVDAIESLIKSPEKRAAARSATFAAVEQMTRREPTIPGLSNSAGSM